MTDAQLIADIASGLEKAGGVREAMNNPDKYFADPGRVDMVREVCKKWLRIQVKKSPAMNNAPVVADYLAAEIGQEKTERFHILYLDTKLSVIEGRTVSIGTVDSAQVYPREALRPALELHAAAVILAHNHPSGDVTPSRADLDITRKLCLAASVLDIRVLDHLIVGPGGSYVSMQEKGFMPTAEYAERFIQQCIS